MSIKQSYPIGIMVVFIYKSIRHQYIEPT